MKVLMICGSLYPAQIGGVDNSVYWLSKSLVENGFEVQIITTNTGIEKNKIQENFWIKTEYGLVKYISTKNKWFPIEWIVETFQLLLKNKSILHFHSLTYSSPFLILMPVLKNKIIWSIHGELEPYASTFGKVFLKKIVFLLYKLFSFKILYHTTSDAESKNAKDILGVKSKIIQLPISMILPEKINGFNRSTEKYFLFIGRLHPIKALENLIQALALSEKFKASEFVFKIVGDGEDSYKKGLEAMIHELGLVEKIKLVGSIEGEKKQELYANAYFTFLISHTENFGIVVIESLAQGTPVVTSKGTPWQILEDRNAGFWVDNDVSSLASVINKISNLNAEEYNTYRENASKLVNEEYNIDSNVEKWIAAYQSL